MKLILLLAYSFLLKPLYAADFLEVKTLSGQSFSGEFIEVYEDRWFYQPPLPTTEKYILLFSLKDDQPHFDFINTLDIKEENIIKEAPSLYKKYLKDHDLFFQNHLVSDSDVLTGNEGHHKYERMSGNFAWDIGILDKKGKQFKNSGLHLEDYYIFGKEVYAPLKGVVIGQVNNQPDNPPDLTFSGDLSSKVNNYLTIQVAPQFYLSLVHFVEGSIEVEVGDHIEVGQRLGEVGNSGVSYLPHLHYTLYTYIKEQERFISIPGFFEEESN